VGQTTIEWADTVGNPVRGCTKVSPGCAHCDAETFAERSRGVPGHPYERNFDLRLVPEKLAEPLGWERPRMVVVDSMSDKFHPGVPDDSIDRVAPTMRRADRHTSQVLTKCAERLRDLLRDAPPMVTASDRVARPARRIAQGDPSAPAPKEE
jgi:protein gp37